MFPGILLGVVLPRVADAATWPLGAGSGAPRGGGAKVVGGVPLALFMVAVFRANVYVAVAGVEVDVQPPVVGE